MLPLKPFSPSNIKSWSAYLSWVDPRKTLGKPCLKLSRKFCWVISCGPFKRQICTRDVIRLVPILKNSAHKSKFAACHLLGRYTYFHGYRPTKISQEPLTKKDKVTSVRQTHVTFWQKFNWSQVNCRLFWRHNWNTVPQNFVVFSHIFLGRGSPHVCSQHFAMSELWLKERQSVFMAAKQAP